ncbi:MAG TPA: glycoside hydrolase family 3 C-terminal domain-containing protein [Anaerolineae bacterium]|nr:glycoside hydrolase family 3 C-terminal domain-containing protein [Anaerolineae bacterium]
MVKVRTVPGTWGKLDTGETLTPAQIEEKARRLLESMTLDEKIDQMSGDMPTVRGILAMMRRYNAMPYPAGENLRLGIPGIRFADGPRGVVVGSSTCFPVPMARGASWDVDLEARIGDAIGVEARAQGANFFGGVCINLLRHPAWGRAQETYGEDPHHLGEMGAALVRGVQRHVMACIKHYACNSIENTRFKVNVRLDERTLREVYLPHFRRCVDEGAAAVMSAYNKVNGAHCDQNRHLLRDILKDEWGFDGFVISDFVFGTHTPLSATAGLDVEMPVTIHFGRRLRRAVRRGQVAEAVIDEAVLRLLRKRLEFAQIGEPARYRPGALVCPEHVALAREAAVKSMVLLQNEPVDGAPVLPLDLTRIERLAVVGHLAALPNTGDHGSSQVRPPYVVTPLEGMRAAVGDKVTVDYDDGHDVSAAARLVSGAGAALLVAGYTFEDEGEYMGSPFQARGGDRASLALEPHDERLIQAVAAANPHTVVVLVGGSAVVTEAWRAQVPAILMAWYSGMEGGHALADLLFGNANPSGKLPCVFPRSASHLPFFDRTATEIEYDLLHGYRLLDSAGHEPAFPFGFGLSYTNYEYGNLRVSNEVVGPEDTLVVCVDVANRGKHQGEEVVQLYAGCPGLAVNRPPRELKAFVRVPLNPGETRQVTFDLPVRRLAYYDVGTSKWSVEPGTYSIYAGGSSHPADLLSAGFQVHLP